MEGLLVFLLSLLLIIQRQCETCTLHKKPCLHACVKKCDHGDCLGADCSGYAGHFLRCPQGTFSIFISSNSSRCYCLMLTCTDIFFFTAMLFLLNSFICLFKVILVKAALVIRVKMMESARIYPRILPEMKDSNANALSPLKEKNAKDGVKHKKIN